MLRLTLLAFSALALLWAGSGCAGPARFVSPEPPPDTTAEAWFASGPPAVRAALVAAMESQGIAIDAAACSPTTVVGVRHQLPYVDETSGGPARGTLPAYRLRAVLERRDHTHVRLTVRVHCPACDGVTPYEWEYPGDVIRRVLDRVRRALGERRPRFAYPARYRPAPWPRP